MGKELKESGVRHKYGITVVAIKHLGADFTHADYDTVVQEGDVLIVAGRTDAVEAFADVN